MSLFDDISKYLEGNDKTVGSPYISGSSLNFKAPDISSMQGKNLAGNGQDIRFGSAKQINEVKSQEKQQQQTVSAIVGGAIAQAKQQEKKQIDNNIINKERLFNLISETPTDKLGIIHGAVSKIIPNITTEQMATIKTNRDYLIKQLSKVSTEELDKLPPETIEMYKQYGIDPYKHTEPSWLGGLRSLVKSGMESVAEIGASTPDTGATAGLGIFTPYGKEKAKELESRQKIELENAKKELKSPTNKFEYKTASIPTGEKDKNGNDIMKQVPITFDQTTGSAVITATGEPLPENAIIERASSGEKPLQKTAYIGADDKIYQGYFNPNDGKYYDTNGTEVINPKKPVNGITYVEYGTGQKVVYNSQTGETNTLGDSTIGLYGLPPMVADKKIELDEKIETAEDFKMAKQRLTEVGTLGVLLDGDITGRENIIRRTILGMFEKGGRYTDQDIKSVSGDQSLVSKFKQAVSFALNGDLTKENIAIIKDMANKLEAKGGEDLGRIIGERYETLKTVYDTNVPENKKTFDKMIKDKQDSYIKDVNNKKKEGANKPIVMRAGDIKNINGKWFVYTANNPKDKNDKSNFKKLGSNIKTYKEAFNTNEAKKFRKIGGQS